MEKQLRDAVGKYVVLQIQAGWWPVYQEGHLQYDEDRGYFVKPENPFSASMVEKIKYCYITLKKG